MILIQIIYFIAMNILSDIDQRLYNQAWAAEEVFFSGVAPSREGSAYFGSCAYFYFLYFSALNSLALAIKSTLV